MGGLEAVYLIENIIRHNNSKNFIDLRLRIFICLWRLGLGWAVVF